MPLLHLRIHCPAELTEPVLETLEACAGAVHLTRDTGAGRRPAGDVVRCDLVRQHADDVLDRLRALGLDERGCVVVGPVDAVMSRWAARAQAAAGHGAADAVVWHDLESTAEGFAQLSRSYLAFMAIAMMIAACGIELDNPILVVGSMVVGPDYGPLAALAVALPLLRGRLALRALGTLAAGFAVGIVVAAIFGAIMRSLDLFDTDSLQLPHPNTAFIWHPDAFSFVVSWLGGAAMALSLTSAQFSSLIGVVISVTTIPAAGAVALNLDARSFSAGRGALEQLLINLAGIAVAGALLLGLLRLESRRRRRRSW
ncbi:MAG TPA: DUF389 domain-containing protein [Actinospica sp.]|nr:DUF389 domain-containing protein [Actinospica sp.]